MRGLIDMLKAELYDNGKLPYKVRCCPGSCRFFMDGQTGAGSGFLHVLRGRLHTSSAVG